MINLATNTNPLGPPRWWLELYETNRSSFERYGELWHKKVERDLANQLLLKQCSVLLFPGLSGVLSQLPFLFPDLSPTGWINPTFWQFTASVRIAGLKCAPLQQFAIDKHNGDFAPLLIDHIRKNNLRSFLLTRPNNPTGQRFDASVIAETSSACPNCLLLVDETYALFEHDWRLTLQDWSTRLENVLTLVSFSKILHLPGLRAALLISANRKYCTRLVERFGPVRVAPIVENVVSTLLSDEIVFDQTNEFLTLEWSRISPNVEKVNGLWTVERRCALFSWAKLAKDCIAAGGSDAVCKQLMHRGVRIMNGADYGHPDYIRFKCGTRSQNDALISAIEAIQW